MITTMTEHPLLALAHKLAYQLRSCSEIDRFRLAEEQVQVSKTVADYIELIKKKQKELVHAKHLQKSIYIEQVEAELLYLNEALEDLPLVREYQQSQVEMNEVLQLIQTVIADAVAEKLDIIVGEKEPRGCGTGGKCGCK